MSGFIVSSRRGVLGVEVWVNLDIKQCTVHNVVFDSRFALDKNALCISIGATELYFSDILTGFC